MDDVKVVGIRKIRKPGPLKAFVDVRMGNITVADFRVFQEDGGPARVEVPMSTWRDPETRQIRFKPVITLSGELMGRVKTEILSCYYRIMEAEQNDKPDKQRF